MGNKSHFHASVPVKGKIIIFVLKKKYIYIYILYISQK